MPVRNAVTVPVGKVALALVLAVGLVRAPAFALRPVGEEGGADTGAPQDAGAGSAAREAAEERSPRPPGPRPSDDDFTPSERIDADSAVSFPVDI